MIQSSRSPLISESINIRGQWSRRLRRIEAVLQFLGVAAVVVHFGVRQMTSALRWEIGVTVTLGMVLLTLSTLIRFRLSRTQETFLRENRAVLGLLAIWGIGSIAILLFSPWRGESTELLAIRATRLSIWSEWMILIRAGIGLVELVHTTAIIGWSPAFIIVVTFFLLICVGTLLLTLPGSRTDPERDSDAVTSFITAVFTATSAVCVTGLTLVDTGTYWSRNGQLVILALCQIGGLGIMTFGGFFALVLGRSMQVREGVLLHELLESRHLASVQRLIVSILGFSILAELIGAVLLAGLWSDLPLPERAYYSLFHSVSAYCNAGFSLMPHGRSFVGLGTRWEVWGPLCLLVIIGGLGFSVLHDVGVSLQTRLSNFRKRSFTRMPVARARLSLSSWMVLVTTAFLLVAGTLGIYLLEWNGEIGRLPPAERLSAAWFQSVMFRSGGFNTVDISALQPTTQLVAILLMFIGASPVSTGGGVKTVVFALSILALISILRGREHIEIRGRTIPDGLVKRALTIIGLGMVIVATGTFLLLWIEGRPERFLAYLFEATSAFGIVGVTTGITPQLSQASLWVLLVLMFIGRVGPLTLLIAVAGRTSTARYEYPQERVTLG